MIYMTHYKQIISRVEEIAKACGRDLSDIRLIVISKGKGLSDLQDVYAEGAREYGENRVEEALTKISDFSHSKKCKWHFIGKLQSKKITKMLPFFSLIHSADSIELIEKINHISELQQRMTSLLLQVNIVGDINKLGLSPGAWEEGFKRIISLSHIKIEGLMTMGPKVNSKDEIRRCFRSLYNLREKWKPLMPESFDFHHLSMGMSRDFSIAIEEGATLLRLGSSIFEELSRTSLAR